MQSTSVNTKKIKIKYKNESMSIFISNNSVKKSLLKEYFPEGSTLMYEINGEKYLLDTNEDTIFLNPNVDTYDVTTSEADTSKPLSSKKMTRVHEILNKLGVTNKPTDTERNVKKALTDMKIGNKKQLNKSTEKAESFIKRVAFLGWKHRCNYDSKYDYLGPVLAPKVKVSLNGYTKYSVETLKEILIDNYVVEKNASYFKNVEVNLATINGKVINSFKTDIDGQENFWQYVFEHQLRNKNHELHLILLTTTKNEGVTTDEINKLPSCSSIAFNDKQLHDTKSTSKKSAIDDVKKMPLMKHVHIEEVQETEKKSVKEYSKERKHEEKLKRVLEETSQSNNISTLNFVGTFGTPSKVFKSAVDSDKILHTVLPNLKENYPVMSKKTSGSEKNEGFEVPKCTIPFLSTVCTKSASRSANCTEKTVPSPSFSKLSTHISRKNSCQSKSSSDDSFLSEYASKSSAASEHYLEVSIRMIKEEDIKFSNVIIGSGGQGCVRKGRYLGTHVAVKSIQKGRGKDDKLVLREIVLLDKIRHPNIILIMAACNGITQLHIVMEYFKSNSLFDIIFDKNIKLQFSLNVQKKNRICKQIISAIEYLHRQPDPIIHRDLKPNNILVNANLLVKLCDLGLGKSKCVNDSLQSTQNDTMRGTYLFMPPEVILHQKEATTSSDIWSFGCTAVELYTEKSVWDSSEFFNGWSCVRENLFAKRIPNMDFVPTYVRPTLYKCFEYDPQKRATVAHLATLFEDIQN